MSPLPEAPSTARILPVARLAAGGRWRVEAMRSLSEPVLYWFTKGQGRMTAAGVTRGYGAHNAIFLPAGTMHGFEVTPQVFGTAVFFGRNPGLGLPEAPLHLRVREAAPQMELNALIDAAQKEAESSRPGHDRAARHYLGLIGVWLERQAVAAQAAEQPKPDATRRLAGRYAELLEREFRSGRGVADYAAALGVTPTHLTRVCRAASGRSAHDILHDRVIFEARRMLLETDLPVNEVSRQLGFTSAAYFTRAFHQSTGKAPTTFRKGG